MKKNKQQEPTRALKRLFPNVEYMVDSNKPITATVNPKDCSDGKKKNASECALAKAVKRQYKADGAIIGMSFSYIIKNKKAIRFMTPPTVAREITSFDRHSDFAAGNYRLSAVTPSQRRGYSKPSGVKHSGSRKISRLVHHHTVGVRVMSEQGR